MFKLLSGLLIASGLLAQIPSGAPPEGSISGVVTDIDTGAPIEGATVSTSSPGPGVSAAPARTTTNAHGDYTLRDIAAGTYRLMAMILPQSGVGGSPITSRSITLAPGQDLGAIDIKLPRYGRIAGKVLDENGEPVPDINVFGMSRGYSNIGLRYALDTNTAKTDDKGEYTLTRVFPDEPIVIVAVSAQAGAGGARAVDAVSRVPADPKQRRPITIPTYYPNTETPEGASVLSLRSGEERQGVDLRLGRSPSYCMEGVLSGPGGPAEVNFTITRMGMSTVVAPISSVAGKTGRDGRIRVCDVYPGDYELAVNDPVDRGQTPSFYGVTTITVKDRDVENVMVPVALPVTIRGEVSVEGSQPTQPVDAKFRMNLMRQGQGGSARDDVDRAIPSEFSYSVLAMSDYSLLVYPMTAPGWYVKDVTYGGVGIMNRRWRPGNAPADARLRILVAHDGGTISARVADKDGKPVAGAGVFLVPAAAGADNDLALKMSIGTTDQNGQFQRDSLPPGKYYVEALMLPQDAEATEKSPELMARLRGGRDKAAEVELGPGASASVRVDLIDREP